MVLRPILRSIQRKILRPIFAAAQRILITADPVLETNFTFQNTKTFPDDFDLSIDAILPTAAATVTLYGQVASADHYIKVLSTGFVSINIDTSIVTSTVLATKDSKQRRYGVRVVGDDFIFTEEGATIDTVTDAVAAAKSLIINVIAQSNGADFFDGTLSDPLLTDLTTTSNSESWAINRPFPATTEQSSSGNNILTYVNAPASIRELFTFNQSDGGWDGSNERVINGGFDTDTGWTKDLGWSISGGVATADGTGNFASLTGAVQFDVTIGLVYKRSFRIISFIGAADNALNDQLITGTVPYGAGTTGTGVFTTIEAASATANKFFSGPTGNGGSIDYVSIKRFIQIAT